jgi:hypothetical protein
MMPGGATATGLKDRRDLACRQWPLFFRRRGARDGLPAVGINMPVDQLLRHLP